jgi:peptidoglycan/xylan/chitin deacetylase (PgdA/CDA1 family)
MTSSRGDHRGRRGGWALSKMMAVCAAITAVAALLVGQPAAARGGQGRIALTFDDLPALSILNDQAYVDYLNIMILRGLKRHHFPATGFVNEGKLDELQRERQIANLRRWLDAGMDLGNHTFSHESPNMLGAAAYIADIVRGEPVTSGLLREHGGRLRWFRHPYLETGFPASVKREIDGWLAAHGYRVAPVTIDADDWEFAEPYDDAIARKDLARQRRIKAEYLAYTARRIDWSIRSGRVLFGRDIAQVMLLHCTRLNADSIDDLAALFRRFHLRPVSLDRALRDPAFRTPDTIAEKEGTDWLERWAIAKRKDLPEQGDDDPPADIQAAYDRVDNDRR